MSALAKIKKTAAQHEQDRQYDKALAQYARLLDGEAGSDEDVDVTLYNRAGDLALRAGDVPRAVTYFERAIDLYAAGGFLNNAVALAVKILRHAPGHLAAHHTLGTLYARKGFRAEARQHLAEYAAQMQRAGRGDEVRRTLAELAALGATADEVMAARELLATRAGGPDDAGALAKGFEDALGPAARARGGADRAAPAAVPLSELIELEVRGQSRPTAESPAPRWPVALPGDPAPLRLGALRAMSAEHAEPHSVASAAVGFNAVELAALDADALELDAFEASPSGGELTLLDLSLPALEPAVVGPTFEVAYEPTFDSTFEATFDVTAADEPAGDAPAPSFDFSAIESRHFAQLHDELTAALPPLGGEDASAAARADVPAAIDDLVDLGEWLRSTALPPSTRLVTPAPRETGDEAADFDVALQAFTAGIAESVDAGDRESHYDLGVAFREMGLLSDAVREFQRALAAPGAGLREREALAQCFLDLGRAELSLATLEDAAADAAARGAGGELLVGVHYVLAESARAVGRVEEARGWYVRVLAADYGFRDAAAHLAALPPPRTPAASR